MRGVVGVRVCGVFYVCFFFFRRRRADMFYVGLVGSEVCIGERGGGACAYVCACLCVCVDGGTARV